MAHLPQPVNFLKVEFSLKVDKNPPKAKVEVARIMTFCKKNEKIQNF